MSNVLAGPPGDCCFRTVQHVGEKRGTIETVAGVETYVSRPKDGSNKKIVLFFADVYGPIYINSQLIMDYWADNGECSRTACTGETRRLTRRATQGIWLSAWTTSRTTL